MNGMLKRPVSIFDSAKGLLRNEHFQVAYATNDLEKACEVFNERFGIEQFGGLEGETPSGGYIRIKLAWVGSTMYELIHCSGPGAEMYNQVLPDRDFALRFHHLGFLIQNQSDWDSLQQVLIQGNWQITQANNTEGFMRHCYIYVPEVGHHFEYMFPESAGMDFLDKVPAN